MKDKPENLKRSDEVMSFMRDIDQAEIDDSREGQYESTRLKRLLTAFRANWPSTRPLTFTSFRYEYPDFPIAVYCKLVPWVFRDVTVLHLHDPAKFRKTSIYLNFLDCVEDLEQDEDNVGSLAMVFTWRVGTDMVLHNSSLLSPSSRTMIEISEGKYLYLEPFKGFIKSAIRLWRT